ncbi:hypothetical protein M422DRAFT_221727 [Sphaerobolus stellatus SS14]|nr:hypothetical protein M422DRAFT_221727 [Sphaerobolus stellatus SS14]
MVNLTQDPASLACPDFTSDEYAGARAGLMEGSTTEAQAADLLRKVWVVNQKRDVARWDKRIADEAADEAATLMRRTENLARVAQQEVVDREEAWREDKKKNPSKYVPIPNRPPPTLRPEIIAPYAQRRIDKGLYCEMYYFTAEGLDAVKKVGSYVDESMVPVTDGAGGMNWIPAIAKRDPGSFKEDQDLTWDQFSGAVPRMLLALQRVKGPAERVEALAGFWGKLLSHPLRISIDPLATKTLLLYQAQQRFAWYEAIPIEGKGWNLNEISEVLMQRAADDVYRTQREELDKALRAKVSKDFIILFSLPASADARSFIPWVDPGSPVLDFLIPYPASYTPYPVPRTPHPVPRFPHPVSRTPFPYFCPHSAPVIQLHGKDRHNFTLISHINVSCLLEHALTNWYFAVGLPDQVGGRSSISFCKTHQ